jgi:histone methylation protein DOT1
MKFQSQPHEQVSTLIEALERDESLGLADNFVQRIRAIELLELYGLDDIEVLSGAATVEAEGRGLIERIRALKQRLEDANHQLIELLAASIRAGDRDSLKRIIAAAAPQTEVRDEVGYDELDTLLATLLDAGIIPDAPPVRDPDMIAFQPTPTRIVLKLIDELHPTPDDVFYDIGSGLGHVPILINLLVGIKAVGVEMEKSYCQYALACLKKLNLRDIALIQADARHVAYDDGTIFYLYTPFQGEILKEVLAKLEAQAKRRRIKVCAYGPCTLVIGKQKWLKPIYRVGKAEGSLGIYTSF